TIAPTDWLRKAVATWLALACSGPLTRYVPRVTNHAPQMKNCRNIITPRRDIVDVITSPPRSVSGSNGVDSQSQHAAQRLWAGAAVGKVVERVFGHADQV